MPYTSSWSLPYPACARRRPRLRSTVARAGLALLVATVAVLTTGVAARARVPGHMPVWAVDDGCNGGAGTGAGFVRHWLTFAESNCGFGATKALRDCHARRRRYCQVMQYMDTDWEYADSAVRMATAASSNWWLHEPAPNVGVSIHSNFNGGGYLINQLQSATRGYFRSLVRNHFDAYDGLFMDEQSASLGEELYYSSCGCSSTSEIRTDRALQQAHTLMSAALTHRNGRPFLQVDNSLAPNPFLPAGLNMLDRAAGVDAVVGDGLPESFGTLDPYYSTLLDQIAYVDHRPGAFQVLMSEGAAGAGYQAQARRIQAATMLLGFSGGHLVDWANLELGSRDLAVWPEEGIYPTRPVQTMRRPRGRGCLAGTGAVCARGGHRDLQVAPGVYRRAFRRCYDRGVAFGACAAVVNTSARPVVVRARWVGRGLHHEITLAGGDVQSGGSLDRTSVPFRANVTTVAPGDALLLAR